MKPAELSVAITGAGGAGVISCGELLLQARATAGGHGLLRKAFGPQIRGGESAALLKFTDSEHYTAARRYDVLVALDWVNFGRFEDEICIGADTLVICPEGQDLPQAVADLQPEVCLLPFAALAAEAHPEGRENMLVTGLLGQLLGVSTEKLCDLALEKLKRKPAAYGEAAAACIRKGAEVAPGIALAMPAAKASDAWYLTGNQAAAYGALQAGVRFAAAYPITPASDVLEWLAGSLEQVGGQLLQAEDELAAINMTIGAAFGGVSAFTATSGPGLALMSESIGLAVASETSVVVLDVMRGGPSTGIPTKSEQSDLNIALHGLHGDAPHLVLAALDIADCAFTTAWAVQLAQLLQTAAIVLSDQFLGQSFAVVSEPRCGPALAPPEDAGERGQDYQRYHLEESGISVLAVPGDEDRRFTADGLEHNEVGTPSAKHSDHRKQLQKRAQKLAHFDYGEDWATCEGDGELALLCFGSASAAVKEAAELLAGQGVTTRTVALRLLSPLQTDRLRPALAGCSRIVVVEQNHSAQLYRYLRGEFDFPAAVSSCALPGPAPLAPELIAEACQEAMQV